MAVGTAIKESDGQAVVLRLSAALAKDEVAYVSGFLGVSAQSGASGDYIALDLTKDERQFALPVSFNPAVGQTVYINLAEMTGHRPNDAAYTVTAGASTLPLFKVTRAKNADGIALGIRL